MENIYNYQNKGDLRYTSKRQIVSSLKLIYIVGLTSVFFSCATDNTSFDTDISVPVSVTEVKTKSIEQYLNTTYLQTATFSEFSATIQLSATTSSTLLCRARRTSIFSQASISMRHRSRPDPRSQHRCGVAQDTLQSYNVT